MKEEWRDIKENPNYMVSNMGRVKSLNYRRTGKEKILKPSTNTNGYLFINLYKNGKQKNCTIHRLVAKAFIPNPDNLPFINHKSEIKSQNNVENLEWCDTLYNNNFGTRNDRMADTKRNGSQSKSVLQKDIETDEIIAEFPSTMEIERQLGYSNGNISQCCNGKRKQAYGYKWQYKKGDY